MPNMQKGTKEESDIFILLRKLLPLCKTRRSGRNGICPPFLRTDRGSAISPAVYAVRSLPATGGYTSTISFGLWTPDTALHSNMTDELAAHRVVRRRRLTTVVLWLCVEHPNVYPRIAATGGQIFAV